MQNKDDSSMIAELYRLYEQKMFFEARSILNDDLLAEDAVHDAFVKLIRHRDKLFDLDSARLASYVRQTLRNTAIDIYRKNKREREHVCDLDDAEGMIGERDCLNDGVMSLIDLLPPKYRSVAVCRFKHELSVKETAAVLKLSESCVKKRIERAKIMLADMLADQI